MLSNLDKHRTLATVAGAVAHEGAGTQAGVRIEWHQYATKRPLGIGETHVSTFTVTSAGGAEPADLTVEPLFGFEIQIEGRPISYLKGFVHDIYPVLYECETGQRLSPFAPYPPL